MCLSLRSKCYVGVSEDYQWFLVLTSLFQLYHALPCEFRVILFRRAFYFTLLSIRYCVTQCSSIYSTFSFMLLLPAFIGTRYDLYMHCNSCNSESCIFALTLAKTDCQPVAFALIHARVPMARIRTPYALFCVTAAPLNTDLYWEGLKCMLRNRDLGQTESSLTVRRYCMICISFLSQPAKLKHINSLRKLISYL